MIVVNGEYGEAKIFTDDVDEESIKQIKTVLDDDIVEGQTVRMMPDVHAGNGCVIGTTMTVGDKVSPSLVGVDIGCGMATLKFDIDEIPKPESINNVSFLTKKVDINDNHLEELDYVIKKYVPAGFNRREYSHDFLKFTDIESLKCIDHVDINGGGRLSLGTLGGGNHFIELNKGKNDDLYLVVHSGSRNLGLQVCNYYNKQAKLEWRKEHSKYDKRPFYVLEGELLEDYLHDMNIMQDFAVYNRLAIIDEIVSHINWLTVDLDNDVNHTIHNYIDLDNMILRKGAISAQKNERVLIPINMRDGSIIADGKGNSDWNYSAPHGAGRLYGRREAKNLFSLKEFEESMEGIYTTCVREDTIDEAPFVYKSIDSILSNLDDTVDVVDIIKPVYNFKA